MRFIAEVSSNHSRDLARALEFIDVAASSGCSAVKFQLFKIDQLFAPEILEKSEMHRKRKEWELPLEFLPSLAKRSHERNIEFSCTPFYLDAVSELDPHVDFYKLASYELLWDKLLVACASTGKPVILSTGMATMDEILHATTRIPAVYDRFARIRKPSLSPIRIVPCFSNTSFTTWLGESGHEKLFRAPAVSPTT